MQKILEIGLGKGKKRQNLAFRSGGIVWPSAWYTTSVHCVENKKNSNSTISISIAAMHSCTVTF